MRRVIVTGAMLTALGGGVAAQQWVPPRPGQDTCSGWSDAAHRMACAAGEAEDRARDGQRRQAEQDRVKAIQEAEAKRIAAERAAAEAARQASLARAAEAHRLQDAADTEAAAKAEVHAKTFDFGADEFGRIAGPIARAHGDYIPARLSSCTQPGGEEEGVCDYEVAPGVDMEVSSRPGAFRAERVKVTWDGDRRGLGPFYRQMMVVGYVLAPKDREGEAINRASALLGTISTPGTWDEKRWTLGHVGYVIRPDPKLGARGAAVFTAEDLGD